MESGLKLITRIADEFTSEFQIENDRSGPCFSSRENYTMFILTASLKGYKVNNIKIDINEDGTLISIIGEKHVKETVMLGLKVYKKDIQTKGFKKVFRIPGEVNLDNIDANFDEDESTLTVSMPKTVEGIRGTEIEEVNEIADLVKEGSSQGMDVRNETQKEGTSNQKMVDCIQERDHERENIDRATEITNDVREGNQKQEGGRDSSVRRFKMCTPIVASSMLVLSFVVFVFQIIRSKNVSSRRRD